MTDATVDSPIGLVENAITERLRTVMRAYPGLLVESYGGQLDDETFSFIRKLPATWVTFDGITEFKRAGATTFLVKAKFEVLVAQRHLQENSRRLASYASAQDVGVYVLLEDNKLALANRKLGMTIQPITPGALRSVMKGTVKNEAIAVYAQAFETSWMEKIDPEADCDGELLRIGLNYFLQPDNPVAAANPNKTDLVTLNP